MYAWCLSISYNIIFSSGSKGGSPDPSFGNWIIEKIAVNLLFDTQNPHLYSFAEKKLIKIIFFRLNSKKNRRRPTKCISDLPIFVKVNYTVMHSIPILFFHPALVWLRQISTGQQATARSGMQRWARLTRQHEAFNQCWFNVGPAS